jgi:predicted AlkP superfamily pyrophosphatase or phosphodiesterase
MTSRLWKLAVVVAVLGAAGCGVSAGAPPVTSQDAARPADFVFIFMLDGTRPDKIRQAAAPTIHALEAAGTMFLQARTVYPSQTRVGFVTLPTGAYPDSHGIIGGDSYKDAAWQTVSLGESKDPIPAQALCLRPTMFEEASAAGLTSLYAGQKGYELVGARGATWTINATLTADRRAYASRYEPEVLGSRALAAHYKQRLSRDLLDLVLPIVRERRPNLAIINLGSVDYAGHSFGPQSAEYLETIEYTDGLIADFLSMIDTMGIRGRTAIVLTADHGFSDVDGRRVVAPVARPTVDALAARGIEHFVTNTGGTSMAIYIRDKSRIVEAAAALRAEPWTESMFCEHVEARCDRRLSELRAHVPGRSPDFLVDLDDDATLNFPRPGNHGSLRDTDMRIPLVFSGAGVREGAVAGRAGLVDVAPTVLRLLGLKQTVLRPDGHVLEEALR